MAIKRRTTVGNTRPIRRRKVVFKRKPMYRRRSIVPRGPDVFKNFKRLVKMRYVTNGTTTTSLGAMNAQFFRCNSIYDPDYSGVGSQPSYHDTYSLIWNKYMVIGSKLTMTYYPYSVAGASDTNGAPHMLGIYIDDDVSTPSNYSTLLESQNQKTRVLSANGGLSRAVRLTSFFSAKKQFGYKDHRDNVDEFGAVFGSNPVRNKYFVCWAQDVQKSGGEVLRWQATIDYVVLLFDPKDMTAS